ncbi:MAG: putative polyketide synthase module [Rhodobacteraceae bacterium HLUCCA12]|nr:MAG: putative polyketide synthase module [Rhodobacteraceae bacterium HLUCCA12]
MAAHLPGADSLGQYWTNLRNGISAIRRLDDAALTEAGEDPSLMRQPNYVPVAAPLDGFARFDAEFFGFSPKEAAILDPQHRQFLEVAWEAMENAGHVPETVGGPVGVFAGCGMGSYFYFNICSNRDLVDDVGMFLLRHTGNDKDFLSTRVSHIFDLRGPSVNIQTACSTSLVAVHYAVQALLSGECDMALAGGVTIELPQGRGYLYKENEILSPDGECHAFDHRAQGTVFGSGAGCVVLKRLDDARRDGDHIWAVIKGTAINNDGAQKAGYLAPSVDGQARAIAEAQAVADTPADTIDYVECHGTGTYLGDPIEVAALTQAFRQTTGDNGFCRIGSVKTNIGHLDTAAGVASVIKAALALHHKEIPPSLRYEAPNPTIDFDNSPFQVNAALTPWADRGHPRRAGVNSLGVGGTNAHAVLQEAPNRDTSDESDWPFQLLTLSARNRSALDQASANLAVHLRDHPDQPLADVAFTLKEGRRAFEHRRVLVAESHDEAAALLAGDHPHRVFTHTALDDPDIVFMFPGGGAQYAAMARDLYDTEPVFREWMDRGLDHLQPRLDFDLRALWLPQPGEEDAANARLKKPSVQLPLIMITEYALAQLFQSWGVRPAALVGHSMGENTAACLAGVMRFEDCIDLVRLRGQLFDMVPAGGMLSVPLSLDALTPYLHDDLDVASINAPDLTVVSGPDAALAALADTLAGDGIETQRIAIDIAAHSRMLEPILDRFRAFLASIALHAPALPVISNRTGQPLTPEQAQSPDYWVEHLRNTVRFADCITTLADWPNRIFLEMGPGKALSSLARMHGAVPGQQVLAALRHPDEDIADDLYHLGLMGRLWALGATFDWAQIWGEARRNRVPLPGYPFQRSEYFIAPATAAPDKAVTSAPARLDDVASWGTRLAWVPRSPDLEADPQTELHGFDAQTWLVFVDDDGIAAPVMQTLRDGGHRIVTVRAGDTFRQLDEGHYQLAPERGREGYEQLIRELVARGTIPTRIAHFWLASGNPRFRPGSHLFQHHLERGFYSLLFLGQAIGAENIAGPLHMTVVTSGAARLRDEAMPWPEKATIAGPARVIPHELPGITVSTLDIEPRKRPDSSLTWPIVEELLARPGNAVAALRGGRRHEQVLRPQPLPDPDTPDLPQGAVWVITGGFGGIGLTLAEALITRSQARIALISRTPLPPRDAWPTLRDNPADPRARRIRAVERLERLGGTVTVAAADVCNLDQMRTVLEDVRANLGPIHGVIHAAGHIDDAPLLAKTTGSVDAVLSPKIHGLRVLETLLPDGAVPVMVLFSSTSTLTAPAGQVDYVAANEYLNAFARARAGGKTRVLAINWGLWSDVGMAAEAMAERLGQSPPLPPEHLTLPLLHEAGFDDHMNRRFSARLDTGHWVLDEHRTQDGRAILPGTGVIEIAAEALRAQGEGGPFEIRDMVFFRALEVDEPREIRVTLARSDEGYSFELRSAAQVRGRRGFALNAQARLLLGPAMPPDAIDIAAISARCQRDVTTDETGIASPQEAHLAFGPRWRVLRRTALGAGEGLAHLSLPAAYRGDLEAGFVLHPALLDLATGWAMALIDGYGGQSLWVPVSYGRMAVFCPLPAEIVSHVRIAPAEPGFASFDITLAMPDGTVCAEIRRFTIKRLEQGFGKPAPILPSELELDDTPDTARALTRAEKRLARNLALGITPHEGADAFVRALSVDAPQVVISSLTLPDLIAEAAEPPAPEAGEGQKFDRPDLGSDYVAPRTDIERMLVGFWEDLLGVEGIGVEDSFFDLGGHSLIAVRLFAKVKKAWSVDFPISVLFEAPTIAKCAAMIAERTGQSDTGMAKASAAPVRRYEFLVPMHEGEGGPKTPFFLVAGMFGNVLNLRHLAGLLGNERPFFGLQARGLLGDRPPHSTLAEAARDYLEEVRQVQPHGPYLLGGFSGGGLTALEMAWALQDAGEEVALLVLLDTPVPLRPTLTRRDKALIKLAELRRKGPGYLLEWYRARRAWAQARRSGAEPGDDDSGFHDHVIEAAFRDALPHVQLRPYTGRTALFRPPLDRHWKVSDGQWVSRAREYVLPDNDWSRWMPDLSVHEVPGDHDSMVLEPNVRVLAAQLQDLIHTAEGKA